MKAQLFLTLLLPAASFAADCFGGTPKSVDSYIKRASELCHACNSPGACVNKGTAGPDNVYCAIINSHTTKYCADAVGDIIAQCVTGSHKSGGRWSYGGETYECGIVGKFGGKSGL